MWRKQAVLLQILGLAALLVGTLGLAPAWAQSRTVEWRRVDVSIAVHDDGTFTVEEVLEIAFIGGPFRYGYRDIPRDRLTAISDVEVADENGPYTALSEPERQPPPRTFYVVPTGTAYTIRWFFEPTQNATRVFRVRYRVHGGLRAYADQDQLWWKAVFPDRDGPVHESVVTVTAPAPVQAAAAYFVPAAVEQVDERTVRFRAQTVIPPGTAFEVRVGWPHGVIPVTPAPWQAAADAEAARLEQQRIWNQRWRPVANVLLLALALLTLTAGLAGIYLLWYAKGRDAPVPEVAEYLTEPPSNLPPALVGTLLDEIADLKEILATLLDLARRGVLTIEERQDALGNPDFVFHLNASADLSTLQPFERAVLDAVMGRRRTRALSALRHRFYRRIPRLTRAIYEASVDAGLFPANPATARSGYAVLGALVFMLAVGLLFVGSSFLSAWVDTFTFFPIALGVLGIALIIVSRFMPRKTPKGAEEAAKWRAFRRYLENLDKFGKLEQAEAILDRYLPYAVAMGVETSFLRTLERALQDRDWEQVWPRWYRPYWYPSSGPAGPRGPSSGGGRVPGHARPAPGGGSGGGLADLSRGIGRGLSGLSTSLGSMLAMTATTMASRPASGGGSTGGFGGFSGGGGAGGGGGGGGGGGFG